MVKRAVAGLLWFFSIWVAYDLIWSLFGVPRSVGPVLGLVAAVIVVIDPTGLCWGKPFALSIAAPSRQRVES